MTSASPRKVSRKSGDSTPSSDAGGGALTIVSTPSSTSSPLSTSPTSAPSSSMIPRKPLFILGPAPAKVGDEMDDSSRLQMTMASSPPRSLLSTSPSGVQRHHLLTYHEHHLIPYADWQVILYNDHNGQLVLWNQDDRRAVVERLRPEGRRSGRRGSNIAEESGDLCPACGQTLPFPRTHYTSRPGRPHGSESFMTEEYFRLLQSSSSFRTSDDDDPSRIADVLGDTSFDDFRDAQRSRGPIRLRPPPSMTTPQPSSTESSQTSSSTSSNTANAASDGASGNTNANSNGLSEKSFNQGYYEKFFVEVKKLGRGQRGSVFLVQHVLDSVYLGDYAVKSIPVGVSHSWLVRQLQEVHLLERL
ncbi:putative serine/threonine-protein kinase iks1, partial [Blyttiomyces sp. JEL0837]